MKRDMDLIRRIALETEALPPNEVLIGVEGASDEAFAMHAIWMKEGGLIAASVSEYISGETPAVHVQRLTWAGCEFIDAVRDDTFWNRISREIVDRSTSFTFTALTDWLRAEALNGFPALR